MYALLMPIMKQIANAAGGQQFMGMNPRSPGVQQRPNVPMQPMGQGQPQGFGGQQGQQGQQGRSQGPDPMNQIMQMLNGRGGGTGLPVSSNIPAGQGFGNQFALDQNQRNFLETQVPDFALDQGGSGNLTELTGKVKEEVSAVVEKTGEGVAGIRDYIDGLSPTTKLALIATFPGPAMAYGITTGAVDFVRGITDPNRGNWNPGVPGDYSQLQRDTGGQSGFDYATNMPGEYHGANYTDIDKSMMENFGGSVGSAGSGLWGLIRQLLGWGNTGKTDEEIKAILQGPVT